MQNVEYQNINSECHPFDSGCHGNKCLWFLNATNGYKL